MSKKFNFKSICSVAGVVVSASLVGCGGLDPDSFSAELNIVDTSNFWAGNQSATVLTIRSNSAEELRVTDVKINNGQCGYEGYRRKIQYPQIFQMGQTLSLQLKGCSYNNVVQVEVLTENGNATYTF